LIKQTKKSWAGKTTMLVGSRVKKNKKEQYLKKDKKCPAYS
jgi:hypothetical protein